MGVLMPLLWFWRGTGHASTSPRGGNGSQDVPGPKDCIGRWFGSGKTATEFKPDYPQRLPIAKSPDKIDASDNPKKNEEPKDRSGHHAVPVGSRTRPR